ncbi:MAG: hypothetical protein KDD89_16135, partial [Anaerolineales bacterium]|nr:hypothetical protein [Anaerolineales bacterium]
NFVISTTAQLSPTGQINATTAYNQALALLGLIASREPISPTSVTWLKDQQTVAGSWPDGFGVDDNPDATALAIMALVAAGESLNSLDTAVAFLQNEQLADGSWGDLDATGLALNVLGRLPLTDTALFTPTLATLHDSQLASGGWTGFGDSASPSSTSEVWQGLVQIEQNPSAPAWRVVVSGTLTSPAEAILAQQGTDGCWPNLFGPGADPFGTTDAIMLLTTPPTAWTFLPEPDTYQLYLPVILNER